MNSVHTTLLFLFFSIGMTAQISYTANDVVTPFNGFFRPACNLGSYTSFTTENLVDLAAGNPDEGIRGVGVKALRLGMFESYTAFAGFQEQIPAYQYFEYLGMAEHTLIVGFPSDAKCDTTFHCSNQQSELFANMYEPIWDNGANGTPINEDNYYAAYLWNLAINYKDYVRFWEIWNEPGFDYTGGLGWLPQGVPGNWWDEDPDPCDYKLRAPIQQYVRLLRISWEVIKSVDPDGYVVVSGTGYPAFLDAILRNTDNPNGGEVTADFPQKGGAYFDVMGYHSYPHFDGSVQKWNDTTQSWDYTRHLDGAAEGLLETKDMFDLVLKNHGYGIDFPEKLWMISEVNLPRKEFGNFMGSAESQRNFVQKAVVACMMNEIWQLQIYKLSEDTDFDNAYGEFDLMGLYKVLDYNNLYFQEANEEGIAYKTVSDILYQKIYDADRTAALNLPDNIGGGAFKDEHGNFTYSLWAKTETDMSENASATYSFPTNLNILRLVKREWDYGFSPNSETITPQNIQLTSSPIYLSERIFTMTNASGCAPLMIELEGEDFADAAAYQWLIEGGTPVTSNLQNTSLTLFVAGEYTATFQVFDANGELIAMQTEEILVEAMPEVDFSAQITGPIVRFLNMTDLNADSFSWDFGDGNTSTEPNPNNLYLADGTYEVILTATNECGTMTSTQILDIDVPSTTQITETANEGVPIYNGVFRPSTNHEFYGGWTDEQLADIIAGNPAENVEGIGVKSLRASIGEAFFEGWGYDFKVPTYEHYSNLDLNGNSFILDFPSEDSRDPIFYCPDHQSNLFKDIYLDIWDDGANGTPINDANPYAVFVYNAVLNYGEYVDFWEVLESPDFDFTGDYAWLPAGEPGNWWDANPDPCDYALRAPVFYYVRQMRIAYEIIKNLDPESYVTVSGIAYPSFLDAILRNTDNPFDGSETTGYELKGGAYFDAIGFKSYPYFDGSTVYFDIPNGQFAYERHSDAAVAGIPRVKGEFETVLENYGYNGQTYPRKEWIISEANVPRKPIDDFFGGELLQTNWIIKAWVACEKNDIRRLNIHKMAESQEYVAAQDAFDVIGLFQKLNGVLPYFQTPNNEAIALKTTSEMLFGTTYDESKTAEFNLPNQIDGAVFRDGADNYIYVLWAKTQFDESEGAFATYSFPVGWNVEDLYKRDWYHSLSNVVDTIASTDVQLTGTPIFLTESYLTQSQLVAHFEAGASEGCEGTVIQFFDFSENEPTEWNWHFVGGTPEFSIEQNPSITYNIPGVYPVSLEASNATGSHTKTVNEFIEVLGIPVADFELNLGLNVLTIENNLQYATEFTWNYGDGTSDGALSPVHTYYNNGEYTVSVIASNICGVDSLSVNISIQSVPAPNFNSNFLGSCDNHLFVFVDASQANPTVWNWTFSGANPPVSNAQFPTVVFPSPGIYQVTLEVSNANGSNEIVKEIYVEGVVTADISVSLCQGDMFQGILIQNDTMIVENWMTQILSCDSMVVYHIEMVETLSSSINIDLCAGELYNGITWANDTIFTETYMSMNGCDSIFFTDIAVFETFVTTLFDTIEIGETYQVSDLTFEETGEYQVTMMASNGCDSTIQLNLTVLDDVAVFENNLEHIDLMVYPNPFNDDLIVEFELDQAENISIEILDIHGRVVVKLLENQEFIYGKHELKWNSLEMASGIYICHFIAGEKVGFQKIIRR
jgi:PKD repeat protein